jgi:hypothetical protein
MHQSHFINSIWSALELFKATFEHSRKCLLIMIFWTQFNQITNIFIRIFSITEIFSWKLMFYKDVRRDLRNSLSYRLAQTDLKWWRYSKIRILVHFRFNIPTTSLNQGQGRVFTRWGCAQSIPRKKLPICMSNHAVLRRFFMIFWVKTWGGRFFL